MCNYTFNGDGRYYYIQKSVYEIVRNYEIDQMKRLRLKYFFTSNLQIFLKLHLLKTFLNTLIYYILK